MLKKCKLCNKQFEPSHLNAKYCSDECRKAAQKQQINDWKKLHPNYFKEWHDANPTYQNRYGKRLKYLIKNLLIYYNQMIIRLMIYLKHIEVEKKKHQDIQNVLVICI